MKILTFIGILTTISLVNRCSDEDAGDRLALIAGIRWFHSFEEDSGSIKTYRPESYAFPPARGRTGFRLEEDGQFVEYTIAPTDGTDSVMGFWKWADHGNSLRIVFPKDRRNQAKTGEKESYLLEWSEWNEEVIRLKKRSK